MSGTCQNCDDYTVPVTPDYSKMSIDTKSCVIPACKINEKITAEGTCQWCGKYRVVSPDRLSCETPVCSKIDREFLDEDGMCKICPEY